MTAPTCTGANGEPVALSAALSAALAAGTREAFTALLTDDVRWGGEQRGGGNECTTRDQAGDHYAGLLAAGVTLHIAALQPADPDADEREGGGNVFTARMQVHSPDPDDYPPEIAVRLTLRDGLLADICILDPPPSIEVLYFEGCPNHEALLPHLRALLAEYDISAPVTSIRIEHDDDAQAHRFLGSPTVRIDGRDVEPAAAERQFLDAQDVDSGGPYGLQCRLYSTPDGITGTPRDQWILDALIDNPTHEAAITAIHTGDLTSLQRLLANHSALASTRLPRHQGRTLLHIATDWPGHYPNIAATIATLAASGADPNAGCLGEHPETPLHWAASSDDIAALDALLDAGADINAPGAVIAGGTPMADATAFGQWEAARRLYERGAATNLFEAAALGLATRVQHHLTTNAPTAKDITSSFWGACHGGHVNTATVLLDNGADINWVGYDGLTPLDAALRSEAASVAEWLEQHGASSAAQPA